MVPPNDVVVQGRPRRVNPALDAGAVHGAPLDQKNCLCAFEWNKPIRGYKLKYIFIHEGDKNLAYTKYDFFLIKKLLKM